MPPAKEIAGTGELAITPFIGLYDEFLSEYGQVGVL
jgi:hypothetical protein